MSTNASKNYLVISALGQDRPGLVNELTRVILDSGCNIVDSRMSVLGGEFAIILLISGTWNAVAKLDSQHEGVEKRLEMTLTTKRTEPRVPRDNLLPYAVDVVSIDQPGIVHHLGAILFDPQYQHRKSRHQQLLRRAHRHTHVRCSHVCGNSRRTAHRHLA